MESLSQKELANYTVEPTHTYNEERVCYPDETLSSDSSQQIRVPYPNDETWRTEHLKATPTREGSPIGGNRKLSPNIPQIMEDDYNVRVSGQLSTAHVGDQIDDPGIEPKATRRIERWMLSEYQSSNRNAVQCSGSSKRVHISDISIIDDESGYKAKYPQSCHCIYSQNDTGDSVHICEGGGPFCNFRNSDRGKDSIKTLYQPKNHHRLKYRNDQSKKLDISSDIGVSYFEKGECDETNFDHKHISSQTCHLQGVEELLDAHMTDNGSATTTTSLYDPCIDFRACSTLRRKNTVQISSPCESISREEDVRGHFDPAARMEKTKGQGHGKRNPELEGCPSFSTTAPSDQPDPLEVDLNVTKYRVNENSQNLSQVKSGVTVTLLNSCLWSAFSAVGTEMIINRSGRRMFPYLTLAVSGLQPELTYNVSLQILPASSRRLKYISGSWLPVGVADVDPQQAPLIHPNSPNTGHRWNNTKIIFSKVKLTNSKDSSEKNIFLQSMHKYRIVATFIVCDNQFQPKPEHTSLSFTFEETDFIAVTAYQNEAVTQMKIHNNPFAKAFRDSNYAAIKGRLTCREKGSSTASNRSKWRSERARSMNTSSSKRPATSLSLSLRQGSSLHAGSPVLPSTVASLPMTSSLLMSSGYWPLSQNQQGARLTHCTDGTTPGMPCYLPWLSLCSSLLPLPFYSPLCPSALTKEVTTVSTTVAEDNTSAGMPWRYPCQYPFNPQSVFDCDETKDDKSCLRKLVEPNNK